MSRILLAIVCSLSFATGALAGDLPNPDLTPGIVREGVSAADLCPVAHTSELRHVTPATKREVYRRYGLAGNHTGYCSGPEGCEVDHLCALVDGGSNDILNLWPEPFDGTDWNAHVKDRLEVELHHRICAGELTPQAACRALATDWIRTYRRYLSEPSD